MKRTFEDYLMEQHALQYIGIKDSMVDDFSDWLQDLEIDDWLRYGERYGIKRALKSIDNIQEKLKENWKEAK